MQTKIIVQEKIKLKNPIFIEGLPGIGNVGSVAAGYLISELKMKKFAELYSPHFLPLVILHDNTTHMLKGDFYYMRGNTNDIIIYTGDTQSVTPQGHYEMCEEILNFAKKLGVKFIITLGGFGEGQMVENPKVIGAVNDKNMVKKFEGFGVDFTDHSVGTIVGTSGLLVGLGKQYGMDGICLMGQTMGYPMITDPKAAEKVLEVLGKILKIKIDLTKLDAIVADMEKKLKKAQELYKQIADQTKQKESIKYIG